MNLCVLGGSKITICSSVMTHQTVPLIPNANHPSSAPKPEGVTHLALVTQILTASLQKRELRDTPTLPEVTNRSTPSAQTKRQKGKSNDYVGELVVVSLVLILTSTHTNRNNDATVISRCYLFLPASSSPLCCIMFHSSVTFRPDTDGSRMPGQANNGRVTCF